MFMNETENMLVVSANTIIYKLMPFVHLFFCFFFVFQRKSDILFRMQRSPGTSQDSGGSSCTPDWIRTSDLQSRSGKNTIYFNGLRHLCELRVRIKNMKKSMALFENKELERFRIVSIKEEGCCMSEVEIHVEWITEGKLCMGTLRFGCVYENESGIAYPWRNNGAWKLYPRDVRVLHMTDSTYS